MLSYNCSQADIYTVFHKKPDSETSCYNFKKTALISKKRWYKQSTCTTKVIVNVQNVVLWPWCRLWVVSSTGQWPRPQSSETLTSRCLLPWKPCSWYSAHTKLFKHNESATEWQCTAWKIILGELILMNLCQPALGVRFFMKHSVYQKPMQCLQLTRSWFDDV